MFSALVTLEINLMVREDLSKTAKGRIGGTGVTLLGNQNQ
jgi:hypothetical protein